MENNCHTHLTRHLTNSLKQSLSWETKSHWSTQEINCLSRIPKIHYHIHNNLSLVPVLSHINSVHTPFLSTVMLILFSDLCLYLVCGLFIPEFLTTILYAFLTLPSSAPFQIHLILFDLIISGYKLERS
jgi:hypothetical protein